MDTETNGGLRNYYLYVAPSQTFLKRSGANFWFSALGFSSECLGQHSGSDQAVNLGDGNGYSKHHSKLCSCLLTDMYSECQRTRLPSSVGITGTPHSARAKRQFRVVTTLDTGCKMVKAPTGVPPSTSFLIGVLNILYKNSGAVFMALSYELPIAQQHDIIPNGYLPLIDQRPSLLIPSPQIQPRPRLASRQRDKSRQPNPHPLPHKHISNIRFEILRWLHLPHKRNIRLGAPTEHECGHQPQCHCHCARR